MRAETGRAGRRGARVGLGAASARWAVPPGLSGPLAAVAGAAALLVVGWLLRAVLRVPTLPEVVSEWATYYVPYWVFEYMINTYRGQAKVMLFWGIVAILALVAVGLGALYARRPTPRLAVALVFGLWLFTMLVVLPGSDMGFFGSEVRSGPMAVSAAYLASYAAFAAVLSLVYWLLVPASRRRRDLFGRAEGKAP